MRRQLLFLSILVSFVLFYSCKSSGSEPAIEGDWISSYDQTWKCTISKQQGNLVMRSNDGGVYYFKKESGESYSTNGGTITLIYRENPISKEACPGYEKFHWNLTGLGERTIKLLNQEKELCQTGLYIPEIGCLQKSGII